MVDNFAYLLPRDVIASFIPDPRAILTFEAAQQQIVTNTDDIAAQATTIADASFLTLTSEPVLGTERVFTLTAGQLIGVDGGANSTYTVSLADTAVTPASYGSASKVAQFTVDQKGRLTAAVEVAITPAAIGAVPTTRTITAGTGLAGGGDLSANRTLSVQSAGTYTATTGTVQRSGFASYTAPTISASPTQAAVQAIAKALQDVSRTLAALVTDLKANGNLT